MENGKRFVYECALPKDYRAEWGCVTAVKTLLLQSVPKTGKPPAFLIEGLTRLFDGQLSPDQRQVLVDYLTPPSGRTADKAWLDERRRGALYLALALPEYHLS